METKPIQFLYNINRMEAVNLIATIHIDDYDTRFLEIVPIDDKTPLVIQGATVTARFVTRKNSLLSDNVACTVTDKNTIIIPIDAAAVHSCACDVKIEVNIVNGTDVLTLPFPLWVRVRGSILGNAHVSPDSEGTIPELLKEVEEELKRVQGFVDVDQLNALLKITPTDIYDGSPIDADLPEPGSKSIYLFGGTTTPYNTGLPPLSLNDMGKVWRIKVEFEDISLTNSTVLFKERTSLGDVLKYMTVPDVRSGSVVEYYYTMSEEQVSSLRVDIQCAAAPQKINVKIVAEDGTDFATLSQLHAEFDNIYTKYEVNKLLGIETVEKYNDSPIDATPEEAATIPIFLFGGNVSAYRTGLPALTASDYGTIWHITVDFENVSLTDGTVVFRERIPTTTPATVKNYRRDKNVASGTVISFDYTMTEADVTTFRFDIDAAAALQKINVIITTEKQPNYVTDEELEEALEAYATPIPDYCENEVKRVTAAVENETQYGDVVFGLYTDIHFGNGENAVDEAQKWNAVKSMRRLADECVLDFVIQGGDLTDKETYARGATVLNRSQYEFSGCRVPIYTSKGDHDSNQTDHKMSKSDFARRTAPYMPQAIRSAAYPNNYYFDLPEKKTRVINIDTGTVMAGQMNDGPDYTTWTNEQLFNWLLDDVFTDDVKNGWRFILFSHAPCDYEWQFGITKLFRQNNPTDFENSQNFAKGNMIALNNLLSAINSGGTFTTDMLTARYELVHDEYGVLNRANLTDQEMGGNVYGIRGIYTTSFAPFVRSKNFAGWTSRARLILSGHCHCDRLNTSTLIPDGNGNYVRGNTSYAIAYTASAAKTGYKTRPNDYYTTCFGDDGRIAAWGDIRDRSYGNISEQLFDIWIVGDTHVKRVRFGAGAGSDLLPIVTTVPTFNYDGGRAEPITVQSAAVNNNGTITFTLSDGSAITTTGTSVIGPQGPAGANGQDGADGISPTATVTQTATGATITVTDANGTTTANIANGQDYNLTAQDKSDIAALVLAQLPTTQGVQYGN